MNERVWPAWIRVAGSSLGALVSFVGLAFCSVVVFREFDEVSAALSEASLPLLGAAGFLCVLCVFGMIRVPFILLTPSARSLTYRQVAGVFFLSNLAKYIPGKVFMAIGRSAELTRLGIPPAKGALMLFVELGVLLLSAGVTAAIFASINVGSGLGLAACSLGLLCIFALTRRWTTRRIARVLKHYFGGIDGVIDLERMRLGECVIWSVAAWTLYSLAGWFIARSMTNVEIESLPVFAVVLPLSWAAGVLAVIAPGGIGVREAAIVVGLAPLLSTPIAVAVAAAFRLTWFAVEILGWAVAMMTRARWSRPAETGDGF